MSWTHRAALAAFIATLSGPALAGSPASGPKVPEAFQGVWNTSADACRTGEGDGQLMLADHQVYFYESGGPIEAVTIHGPRDISVAAKLSGEGETWTDITRWRLSADGQTLTDITDPNETHRFVRVKCPMPAPVPATPG